MRVLVVEDDARLASFIRRGLEAERYTVDLAADGEQALYLVQTGVYDLLLLDLLIPGKDGLEVLRELRREHFDLPVLILTGRESLADRVRGLDAGADDYLTKPFGFAELLARMRALQRRRGVLAENVLRIADLEMDVVRHQVTRSGRPVELTPREYAVLEVLLRNATRVVSRTALLEQAWAQDFDPLTNVVEVCIARLRRKIDTDGNPPLLHTVRGSGYVLRDASLQEPAGAPETPSARVDSASRQLRG